MATTGGGDGDRAKTQVVISVGPDGTETPVTYLEGELVNARQQKLFTAEWVPMDSKNVKAIVIFHHGLSEYAGRYSKVMAALAAAGIAVYSYDAHGQGHSEPTKPALQSHMEDWKHMLDDFELRLKGVKEAYAKEGLPLPPVFAAGHSLGGLIAALAVVHEPSDYAGLVMHSPAVDVEWTATLRFQAKIGGMLAAMFPTAAMVPAVRPEDMSQDKEVVKEYLADPLIYTGKVKCCMANESLKAMAALQADKSKLTVPLYIAHGKSDRCTSVPASKRLYETAPAKDKTYNEVEGGYHELLHGPEKAACLATLLKWIVDRSTPGFVAPPPTVIITPAAVIAPPPATAAAAAPPAVAATVPAAAATPPETVASVTPVVDAAAPEVKAPIVGAVTVAAAAAPVAVSPPAAEVKPPAAAAAVAPAADAKAATATPTAAAAAPVEAVKAAADKKSEKK